MKTQLGRTPADSPACTLQVVGKRRRCALLTTETSNTGVRVVDVLPLSG